MDGSDNMNRINGWLNIDKPKGLSSARVVAIIKKLVKPSKVGHAGTLDPLASGVLPIAVGEATKTAQYAMLSRKSYSFTITWGEDRDTLDAEGAIIKISDRIPAKLQIEDIVKSMRGDLLQTPPQYSAVLINGQRAYKLARQGKAPIIEPRNVRLYDFKLIACDNKEASFEIECSKGFYVRALARDIVAKLGVCGYVSALRRTSVGKFMTKEIISLDYIKKIVHNGDAHRLLPCILPVHFVLDDILVHNVDDIIASKIKSGQGVFSDELIAVEGDRLIAVFAEKLLIAICRLEEGLLKPVRVFNL